mmetsp:Transcript_22012/g.54482  ORF Transcript_22012/g.54482 Transcript_22012/m.54482 type:complete len:252 (-) Transcript_22012:570-1325(-)
MAGPTSADAACFTRAKTAGGSVAFMSIAAVRLTPLNETVKAITVVAHELAQELLTGGVGSRRSTIMTHTASYGNSPRHSGVGSRRVGGSGGGDGGGGDGGGGKGGSGSVVFVLEVVVFDGRGDGSSSDGGGPEGSNRPPGRGDGDGGGSSPKTLSGNNFSISSNVVALWLGLPTSCGNVTSTSTVTASGTKYEVRATTAHRHSRNTPKMIPAKLAPTPTRRIVYLSPITRALHSNEAAMNVPAEMSTPKAV